MITWASCKALTDSLGVQLDRLKTALGTGVEAGTVSGGGGDEPYPRADNRRADAAANDPQTAADLLAGLLSHKANVMNTAKGVYTMLRDAVDAMVNHVKLRGTSNSGTRRSMLFCLNEGGGDRFSPSFAELARALAVSLDPASVYAPVTSLGTFAVTGSGAGIFTPTAGLDPTLYGPADIEAVATAACSNVAITAVCKDQLGATVNATGTLNGTTGTKVDLAIDGDRACRLSALPSPAARMETHSRSRPKSTGRRQNKLVLGFGCWVMGKGTETSFPSPTPNTYHLRPKEGENHDCTGRTYR